MRTVNAIIVGADVGLMGAVADAVLNAGGVAIGVIPKHVHRDMLLVADAPHELLARFAVYRAPRVKKWRAPAQEKNRSRRTVLSAE